MFFVYVLFSHKDQRLYVGYTNDLERRMKEHMAGTVEATRARRPLVRIYYECYPTQEEAMRREKFLKGGNGREQLKIQLFQTLKELSYKFRRYEL